MTLATTSIRLGHTTRLDFPASRVALELPPGLSLEEWKEIGVPLLDAGQSLMWWIGDWMNYGELEYRESYAQATAVTGMDYQTIANAKWVCERVEVSRRRENLSFGHHASVAALDRRSQTQLLNRAVKEGLTVQALRAEVKRINEERRAEAEAAVGEVSEQLRKVSEAEKTSAGRSAAPRAMRTSVALRVTARVADEAAVRAAIDRAAAGLRDWFAGEGIDAKIDVDW